jgi:hypothetical protein
MLSDVLRYGDKQILDQIGRAKQLWCVDKNALPSKTRQEQRELDGLDIDMNGSERYALANESHAVERGVGSCRGVETAHMQEELKD